MPDRQIAAFDFDGTLTHRDTLLPFLVRACGARRVATAVARVAPVATRARTRRLHDALHHRDAVKVALLRDLFRGRDPGWLAAEGASFAATLPGRLRPAMAEQLAWHREHGHELVIVSAGLHAYLGPFGEAEGFDQVISVELATGPAGRLTGELVSPNVRGAEKAHRFRAWLDGDDPGFVWAYGNSTGDTELLELADVPVWMSRRQKGGLTLPAGATGTGSPAT
ncbi:HAD-IB family hydrolase [soil metagenome]